ncbi:MAG: sugar MFS transporter [Bacteroidales bacterium]|nr:sugar MFS transporter [Bacteroidales bacterium]
MKTIEKRYLVPFILVTSLFLLWGIANNMTDTLLSAFKRIMSMSDTQTSLIQLAFYGSYFCFALPAAIFIRKKSYKSGVILGLALYAAGAILFLPAAKAASYGFYLMAIYILAGGCSVLETTANPYILAMGAPETATRRLNVAQAFNPLGSIIGILLSKYFILKDISLYSVSGTYMTLGMVLLVILVVMLFVRMPEGRDDGVSDSLGATFRRLLKNRRYAFGVVAQFFYVGAQIGVWSFTIRLVMQELGILEAQGATLYLISIICFSVARFLFTWLMKYFRPARLLLFAAAADIVLSLLVVLLGGAGWPCVIALIAVSFFMSLMFPTIYGLALDGVEDPAQGGYAGDAKIGASGLIMAILGGALITPLQGMVSDAYGINLAYIVPLFCFVVVFAYAYMLRRA